MDKQGPYSLLSALEAVKDKGKPPIHLWDPDNVKDIDMEIKANGDWYYLGTPINRIRLVHLFASVLRLEQDGKYYLVTPVEKCRIRVADVPFQVVSMTVSGSSSDPRIRAKSQCIDFVTNMAETFTCGREHRLRFVTDAEETQTLPYVEVRDGLEARIGRSVYYELAELMTSEEIEGRNMLGIWSDQVFFPAMEMPVEDK